MIWFILSLICSFFLSEVVAVPAQVVILRHAEKPDEGNSLSKQGFERATALVPFFTQLPTVATFQSPAAVYVPYSSKNYPSTRALQTVSALANFWAVPLYARYTVADITPLVSEIMNEPSYDDKMVLLCWEHDHIPNIAKAFGITRPPAWPGHVFDRVWVIDFTNNQVSSFQNSPQQLMYGDSAQ